MGLMSVLPRAAVRAVRKAMLAYGRRLNIQGMLAASRHKAVRASVRAARDSSAYRQLLEERGIKPPLLGHTLEWNLLPVLTKANTFERFTLRELCKPLPANDLGEVLTSSGRSGSGSRSFGFRLGSRQQLRDAWFDIDMGLQDVFGVDEKTTLLVNCLPMGVTFQSRAVTVANVSVREDMACSILRDVGPRFEQTVLCTDPLFIRRILDEARSTGVDWNALNTSVVLGEEMLVESQRDFLAARMGIDIDQDSQRLIGSSFGLGELGLNLLFETRETIRMRRAMRNNPVLQTNVCGSHQTESMPALFCYNPLRSHIEVINPAADGFGELCITMLDNQAVIPLPRYATGDAARLVNHDEMKVAMPGHGMDLPWLPMIALKGRIKDRGDEGPAVESIKELIYLDHDVADHLTGAFRLSRNETNGFVLILQAHAQTIETTDLLTKIRYVFAEHGHGALEIELKASADFPWRPSLDFERKFPYRVVS